MNKLNLRKNAKLLAIFLSLLLVGCGGDLGSGKHVSDPATILDIGDCGGGNGFFAGNRECAVKIKWDKSGVVEYTKTWSRVMIGQKVYRECWDDGCFAVVTPNPRDSYKSN